LIIADYIACADRTFIAVTNDHCFSVKEGRFSNTCFCATAPAASPRISSVSPGWGGNGFGAGVTTEIEDVLLTQNAILLTIMKRCKSHTT
jgi:hypothetical protein